MDGGERISSGVFDFLKAFGANVVAIVHSRLALLSAEAAEEKQRVVQLLVWTVAGIFSGMMAVILLNVTIVYLFWEEARLAVLVGLTVFYTLALAVIAIGLRRQLKSGRLPFANTMEEFRKDYECFRRGR